MLMKKNLSNNDVDAYLSLKRIFVLSLAITTAYYILFVVTHYFGRPSFANGKTQEERMIVHRNADGGADKTMHMDEAHKVAKERPEHRDHHGPYKGKKPSLAVMLLLNIPLTYFMVFVVFLYNRKMMSLTFKWQRDEVMAIVLGSLVLAMVLSSLCTMLQLWIWPHFPGPPKTVFQRIRSGWLGDLPLMALVILTCYLVRSLYQEKKIAVENETLRAENIRTHYEALKHQLDPHFLFNSMNTLKTLIPMDSEKAEEFVMELSSVLRYTLQNKEVVSLADEMACVEAYCNMMKCRYGDNLRFEVSIDAKYNGFKVLPLSVQGLIENAIKHNVISARQPLDVCIVTEKNGMLRVSNTIQPKVDDEGGNGIGLANLSERYRLQWDENVIISNDGKIFSVTLPLKENE